MRQRHSAERTAIGLCAVVLVLAGAALWHVDRAGRQGRDPLTALAPVADAVLALSAALYTSAATTAAAVRAPAAALVLAALALLWLRKGPPSATARLLGGLGLGWIAQSLLADGHTALPVALYAAACLLYLARRSPPDATSLPPLPARFELPAYALCIAVFLVLALHRLDLHPRLYFDEIAYALAARMELGDLPPGPVRIPPVTVWMGPIYSFERFHAQTVPFLLHAAAFRFLTPGVLAPRLLAVALSVGALLVSACAVRRHLGPRVALGMTAFACTSPLFVAYARPGFYLAATVLHGAISVGVLLRVVTRGDARSALGFGVLCGSALYFYQLSWFVPVLGALVLLVARPPGSPRRLLGLAALTTAAAAATCLPAALWLRTGMEAVGDQTLGRGSGLFRSQSAVSLSHPERQPLVDMLALQAELAQDGLGLRPRCPATIGATDALLTGPRDGLAPALRRLEAEGWSAHGRVGYRPEILRRVSGSLGQLFSQPGCESAGRAVAEPALTHLLAPLILLGLLEAWRRRRDPTTRVLAVWVLGAMLIPAWMGGPLPRRLLLMLPFVYALATLPLIAVLHASAVGSRARAPAVAGIALLLLASGVVGIHGYFGRWYVEPDSPDPARPLDLRGSFLDLSKVLKTVPRDMTIAMPRLFSGDRQLLRTFDGETPQREGGRLAVRFEAKTAQGLRDASCALEPPFVWAAPDDPQTRRHFAALHRDFRLAQGHRGPFLFVSVLERRPGACD
jgi:hypothetical protein